MCLAAAVFSALSVGWAARFRSIKEGVSFRGRVADSTRTLKTPRFGGMYTRNLKKVSYMQSDIGDHLAALYGRQAASGLRERLEGVMGGLRLPGEARGDRPLTERDAMLITYGDQIREPGVAPLRTLAATGRRWWRELVSAIHILPFYPYSSDDGFSVKDYGAVRSRAGRLGRRAVRWRPISS